MKKLTVLLSALFVVGVLALPVRAQEEKKAVEEEPVLLEESEVENLPVLNLDMVKKEAITEKKQEIDFDPTKLKKEISFEELAEEEASSVEEEEKAAQEEKLDAVKAMEERTPASPAAVEALCRWAAARHMAASAPVVAECAELGFELSVAAEPMMMKAKVLEVTEVKAEKKAKKKAEKKAAEPAPDMDKK